MSHPPGRTLAAYLPDVGRLSGSLVAVVCAASAGVNAALVPEHLQESLLLGVAFGVAALALVYVLSRTTGLPGPQGPACSRSSGGNHDDHHRQEPLASRIAAGRRGPGGGTADGHGGQ